jgi:transposase
MTAQKQRRIIGLDVHPDVFSAAALLGNDAASAQPLWQHDRIETAALERWARKHLQAGDTIVLEASGNSFNIAQRLQACGHCAIVLESAQASKIKHNFCNDDRQSAVKLARVYLSGLAKEVWQPDARTGERRDVLFAHRSAVKDSTIARNRLRGFLNAHGVRLPAGTSLTKESTETMVLNLRPWSPTQSSLLQEQLRSIREAQAKRVRLEKLMIKELASEPQWSQLWRLMGVRHIVAFALMAMIGTIERFRTAKNLVGYLGLAPRRDQSGNNIKGITHGVGCSGRKDLRSILLQSAQNALNQRQSPLHKWGWRLHLRKNRHIAAVAVARKLTVAVWHLLKGHYSPLEESSQHLDKKLRTIATILGLQELRALSFTSYNDFISKQTQLIRSLSP